MLTIYAIEISEIYGHGKRLVIWFSGCSLGCNGCINEHLWNKSNGTVYQKGELLSLICSYKNIVGVTYIGGEPLEQNLEDLLYITKELVKNQLDLVLFTGYELSELNAAQYQISKLANVVVAGRYDASKRDTTLLLRGSSNQKIKVREEKLKEYYLNESRQVEIEITENDIMYLGFPEDFI